jgi:glucose-6-phosphate 1-epimerase
VTARAGIGRGGLPTLEVDCEFGAATVYLHGAHVTSWRPAGGDEMLFVSEAARFGEGESIRGGVPLCFPQFAELGPLPMHGFASVVPWEWSGRLDAGAVLTLHDTEQTRALWPHRFAAALNISLSARTLALTFTVENLDEAPLQWSGTLHTFLALDARRVRLRGLGPARYVDRAHASQVSDDAGTELRIPGHTDRAYLDAGTDVEVDDGRHRFTVSKSGFRDTVVWNPGPETSDRFPDLKPDDHLRFVCVEAAEVRPVTVAPGVTWRGSQTLRARLR